jgi:mevalonate kinase
MKSFSSYAKWILSGEHAVVRGGKAIAFPLRCYKNSIFLEKAKHFSLKHDSENSRSVIVSLMKMASAFTNMPLEKISSEITVNNNIPTKKGLGSSAAVCANIANLFEYHGFGGKLFDLARHLENKFHQNSSGLDVSVALENAPIVFQSNRAVDIIKPAFWPHLALSYSGEESITSNCVKFVQKIFLEDESRALELDSLMNQSADLCESALKNADFEKLRDGINLGCEVFSRWGLCHEPLKHHIDMILSAGAVAAKPIGSGLGGYVLSLWQEAPQNDIYLTLEKP